MASHQIKSVAIIGAGASGAITAAALAAENYYDVIRVFERRDTPGGTWIYDDNPDPPLPIMPGKLPPETDPALAIPPTLPTSTPPNRQERYLQTPVYNTLTTNVPDIAMSFSDSRFAYGPFAPHWVPRQYIESYFSKHRTDSLLVLNTTVEDVSQIVSADKDSLPRWKLTLRKYAAEREVDDWWEETFDAVVLANGHYAVPFVPPVPGLDAYLEKFPDRVVHSKYYRSPAPYVGKKVLVVGNSASGYDIAMEIMTVAKLPVYQSRRTSTKWDGRQPKLGIAWKPVIKQFNADGGIVFTDDSVVSDFDVVVYCTGYQPSFSFWNEKVNGQPIWDYENNKLHNIYWHTFFQDFPTLAIVGIPRGLNFRSFEYQAIALARVWSGRNAKQLPSKEEQQKWEQERAAEARQLDRPFHDIGWETGETERYLQYLHDFAGVATLKGEGRVPPPLTKEMIWAVENLKKYPEPKEDEVEVQGAEGLGSWVLVKRSNKDLLSFV